MTDRLLSILLMALVFIGVALHRAGWAWVEGATRWSSEHFEVHEHCYISGPNINLLTHKFSHSHPNGNVPHTHPDTGPSSYTIDKDEWFAATGLKGGGRKKFTAKPTGSQLPFTPRTAEEQVFYVVVDPSYTDEHVRAGIDRAEHEAFVAEARAAEAGQFPPARKGRPGRSGAAVANMALRFDMTPIYKVES